MASTFRAEIAKTSRSKCKNPKCDQPAIDARTLRLGKEVADFFRDGATTIKWHHPTCFFEVASRARKESNKVTDPEQFSGYEELSEDDQRLIQMLVAEAVSGDTKKKQPKPKKQPAPSATPPKAAKPKPASKSESELDDHDDDHGDESDEEEMMAAGSSAGPPAAAIGSAQLGPDGREACWYGAKCYRVNPQHLQEYWHPPKSGAAPEQQRQQKQQRQPSQSPSAQSSSASVHHMQDDDESDFSPSDAEAEADEDIPQIEGGHQDVTPKEAAVPLPSMRDDDGVGDDDADSSWRTIVPQMGSSVNDSGPASFHAAMPGRPFVPELPVDPPGGSLAQRPTKLFVPMEVRRGRFKLP